MYSNYATLYTKKKKQLIYQNTTHMNYVTIIQHLPS